MLSFIETIYFIFKEKAKTFSMDTEALEYPVYPCADNCCFSFKKKNMHQELKYSFIFSGRNLIPGQIQSMTQANPLLKCHSEWQKSID